MVAMFAARIQAASERKEPQDTNLSWGARLGTPTTSTERSSPLWLISLTEIRVPRKRQTDELNPHNGLFAMGSNNAKVQKAVAKSSPAQIGRKRVRSGHGTMIAAVSPRR